jgi:hypothetical protein
MVSPFSPVSGPARWVCRRCWGRRAGRGIWPLGLIISRVVRPSSKLATLGWWADTTLGVDLDITGACTEELYAATDWLADRQEAIQTKLAAKHLGEAANPSRMALSCWR